MCSWICLSCKLYSVKIKLVFCVVNVLNQSRFSQGLTHQEAAKAMQQ